MKQFDVIDIDDAGGVIAVTVLSAGVYLDLPNILVVPLYAAGFPAQMPEINPTLEFRGIGLVAVLDEIASAPAYSLQAPSGRLTDADQARIKTALDRLIAGY